MQYDIVISGTIGSWDCLSTGYLRYVLNGKKDSEVHVAFCSLGGYVKTGLEFNQLFKDHGNVHAHAFGMNASISTIAMLGCKDIDIVKGSFFLIHNTSSFIDEYDQKNKEQIDEYIKNLTKQRNDLSTFDDVLAQMYADKTGKKKEECAEQMNKGNWLNAQQALDFGLVDSIREDKVEEKKTQNVLNQFNATFNTTNNIFKEAGIPPLPDTTEPEVAAVVDSEGNPTPGFLQKALQGLKDLFQNNNADKNDKDMSKPQTSFAALAAVLGVETLALDAEGKLVLTEEQVKTLNEKLPSEEEKNQEEKKEPEAPEAPKDNEPKDELAELKAELAKLKNDLTQKDEQIKNLNGTTAPEDETKENPKEGNPTFSALDIAKSIKDV